MRSGFCSSPGEIISDVWSSSKLTLLRPYDCGIMTETKSISRGSPRRLQNPPWLSVVPSACFNTCGKCTNTHLCAHTRTHTKYGSVTLPDDANTVFLTKKLFCVAELNHINQIIETIILAVVAQKRVCKLERHQAGRQPNH